MPSNINVENMLIHTIIGSCKLIPSMIMHCSFAYMPVNPFVVPFIISNFS